MKSLIKTGLVFGLLLSAAVWAATSTAFNAMSTTKTVSASTTSASATWADNDKAGDCLRVFNNTTAVAFLKYGIGAQTATTANIAIAPGAVEVIAVGDATDTVAVILSTGTGSVYLTKGSGL